MEWRVPSVKCELWSVGCEVRGVWSAECEVQIEECRV